MTTVLSRRSVVAGLGAASSNLSLASAWAQTLSAARVATGLRATAQCLTWIGMKTEIFRQLGVGLIVDDKARGGPGAAAALFSGEVDFIESGSSPIVQGVLDGRDGVILAAPLKPVKEDHLAVRKDITEPAQLNGGRIGVATVAGQQGLFARSVLRHFGISASLVELKTSPQVYAQLGEGKIDAGVLNIEYRIAGEREFGFRSLAVPAPGFLSTSLATTRRRIEQNRDLVARVVRGYVEAIHFFRTKPAETALLVSQYLGGFSREASADVQKFYAERFDPLPLPSLDGIHAVLRQMQARYPAAQTADPASFVDMSFLQDLERSGLVKKG